MTEKEGEMNTTIGFWADLHRHTLSQVTIDKSNLCGVLCYGVTAQMWTTVVRVPLHVCVICSSAKLWGFIPLAL